MQLCQLSVTGLFLIVILDLLIHVQLNPDNSNLQGKLKKVRVIGVQSMEGKINKKMTWRRIEKGLS